MVAPTFIRTALRTLTTSTGLTSSGGITPALSNLSTIRTTIGSITGASGTHWVQLTVDSSPLNFTGRGWAIVTNHNITNMSSYKLGLVDGSGNTRMWTVPNNVTNIAFSAYLESGFVDTGVFAVSNVVAFRIEWTTGSAMSGRSIEIFTAPYHWLLSAGPSLTGGEVGNTARISTIGDSLVTNYPATGFFGTLTRVGSLFDQYLFTPHAITINSDVLSISSAAIVFANALSVSASRFSSIDTYALNIINLRAESIEGFQVKTESSSDFFAFTDSAAFVNTYRSDCALIRCSSINLGIANFRGTFVTPSGAIFGGTSFTGSVVSSTSSYAIEWNGTTTYDGLDLSGTSNAHYINCSGANFTTGATLDVSNITFGTPGTRKVRIDASGKTLNILTAGGFTISDVTVVAGTVNIISPSVDFTWDDVEDGTRVYAARYQTFVVAAADINTTANTIALGNDEETASTFAGQTAAPATMAYVVLAPGATIPTSSPQIVSGNLYYVVSNSSGVVGLSETEGGSAIDFTTAGTDSGGMLLFIVCTTELVNEVASGGVTETLSVPNGASLEVAAQGLSSDETQATILFHRVIQWSSLAGASIADAFSLANNPDPVYNALEGATLTSYLGRATRTVTPLTEPSTLPGISFDVSGNIELDADAADESTLFAGDAYRWMVTQRFTEAGIRFIRDQFTAESSVTYNLNGVLTLDNIADGVRNSPGPMVPLTIVGNLITLNGAELYASETGTIRVEPMFAVDIATTIGSGLDSGQAAQLAAIENYTRPMAKQLGLVAGVTATHTPTAITVSDADGSTTITDNGGGSYTVEGA